jgi:hypothetical protein
LFQDLLLRPASEKDVAAQVSTTMHRAGNRNEGDR